MSENNKSVELVNIKIDEKDYRVPKGMNLIDAASSVGVEIPHYCYHPHLSIAGNCRMCQVEIKGSPKLGIACNTMCAEGLEIKTHFSSPQVEETQRATLEFLLINHPLDCTVCDQAGHCKLQDYYYEYDGKASRFIEDKVNKVKAEVLGPQVVYDGERCIMCTRCVRFCDEVTKTSELGAYNRGDKGVIGVVEGNELNNPLSGSVVDLCPVGALTHRKWRFNTRIWYTKEVESVCAGCSTGCNVKVSTRDNNVVHVKARLNSAVNQEWLCDEGRYGFDRFQPQNRLTSSLVRVNGKFEQLGLEQALNEAAKLKGQASSNDVAVFISPHLTMEQTWVALEFAEKFMGASWTAEKVSVQIKQRVLSDVEKILVSPDYAASARAVELFTEVQDSANWREKLESRHKQLLAKVVKGEVKRAVFIGDNSVANLSESEKQAIANIPLSVAITSAEPGQGLVQDYCAIVIPTVTINEKNGILVNKDLRLQKIRALLMKPQEVFAECDILSRIAKKANIELVPSTVKDERALFNHVVSKSPKLNGLTLFKVGELGINFTEIGNLNNAAGDMPQGASV